MTVPARPEPGPTGGARGTSTRRGLLLAALAGSGTIAAGCERRPRSASAGNRQRIVLATQGLGDEGQATTSAVREFHRQNPDVEVTLRFLDGNTTRAFEQLSGMLRGGTGSPDVLTLDVIWPATFAEQGLLLDLGRFRPDTRRFVPAQVEAGTYDGLVFAIPWFINAEGLYYRTDLVPAPPRSPEDVISYARGALAADSRLTSGFAFAGARFEGVVTVFLNVVGGFGGQLDPARLQSPQTLAALTYLADAVRSGVAPARVRQWQEQQVADEFVSGRAVFAMNWPYMFEHAERPASAVRGKTGWIPFPAGAHTPAAALGGSMLALAASSPNPEAGWRLIDYLTSGPVQVERAITAGDPPALPAAYTQQLVARAPHFGKQRAVFQYVTPRPVVPNYLAVSAALQAMLSDTLSGARTPEAALAAAASALAGTRS